MKKRIVYIGNKLSSHGYTPTNVETLGPQLATMYDVITASDKKNKLLRLLDVCFTIIKNRRKTGLILIDTYSTSAFKFALAAGFLARQFGIPYVPILHGGDLPKKLKVAKPNELLFFEKAACLVAPSAYLYHQFSEFGFKHLVFIANNISLSQYAFKRRNELQPRLLWVRSFHKIYNANMALHVLERLLQTYPNASLCMVGPDKDGSLDLAKQEAINLGIANRVAFTGKLSKTEWHQLAADYDIFINTTTIDNTPVSVIEAMALGLPVVSTNVGGIPYLLQHEKNALLVPSANVDVMADAIQRLLADNVLAAQMITTARELTETFDWEAVRLEWNKLIERIMEKK